MSKVLELDHLPDVRDGLTHIERIILWQLQQAQAELGRSNVPSALLYGRVVEHVNVSPVRFEQILARLSGRGR
jgi:hypothetical protein